MVAVADPSSELSWFSAMSSGSSGAAVSSGGEMRDVRAARERCARRAYGVART